MTRILAFKCANLKNRHELLAFKQISTTNETSRIITTYTNDHSKIRQICQKYWHLLTSDPTIGPFVPPMPLITYRRATSVGDLLVQIEFKGYNRGDPCTSVGTFQCGSCSYCRYMDTRKNVYLPNGIHFVPRHYANCQTTGVVYMLLCNCNCFYVGKTLQKLMAKAFLPH